MVCRRPPERTSAPCRAVQSRVPRSGLTPDYASLIRIAAPLDDASTTREAEVASTLTLLPKQRGRESTGGCQVLRFAALLTGPEQHPRLALPDSQALSKPRIPTGPNVGSVSMDATTSRDPGHPRPWMGPASFVPVTPRLGRTLARTRAPAGDRPIPPLTIGSTVGSVRGW